MTTLSNGFFKNIIPNDPIIIKAIAIIVTAISSILFTYSIKTSLSNLFRQYAIAFALIVEQMKNAAATIRAKGVAITNAIRAETPKPITFI